MDSGLLQQRALLADLLEPLSRTETAPRDNSFLLPVSHPCQRRCLGGMNHVGARSTGAGAASADMRVCPACSKQAKSTALLSPDRQNAAVRRGHQRRRQALRRSSGADWRLTVTLPTTIGPASRTTRLTPATAARFLPATQGSRRPVLVQRTANRSILSRGFPPTVTSSAVLSGRAALTYLQRSRPASLSSFSTIQSLSFRHPRRGWQVATLRCLVCRRSRDSSTRAGDSHGRSATPCSTTGEGTH